MAKKEIIEILGIVTIIGSLIFVGIEIRQNSLSIRGETYQSIAEHVTSYTWILLLMKGYQN